MVVISGTAIAIGVIGSTTIGGLTIYGVTKVVNGGDDFPPITNSSIGWASWEKKTQSDLVGIDFNFQDGSAMFEVGLMVIIGLVILTCMCCGCSHCMDKPEWMKRREEKRKLQRRKRLQKKKTRKMRDAELEEERLARKAYWREVRANEKSAKKQAKHLAKHLATRRTSEAETERTLESVTSWYSGSDFNSPDSWYGSEDGDCRGNEVALDMETIEEENEEV